MEDGKFSKDCPHEWVKKIRSRPARQGPSKRMRQVDLAKRVGVDPRTVQQWENGDRLPGVGNLKRIIQVFWEEGLFWKATLVRRRRSSGMLLNAFQKHVQRLIGSFQTLMLTGSKHW